MVIPAPTDRYWERVKTVLAEVEAGAYGGGDPKVMALLEHTHPEELTYQAPATQTREHLAKRPGSVQVPVRIYSPKECSGRPILVWCHGGAFVGGDLDMPEADATAREISARADSIVISVNYRLAVDGQHYPVPLDDVVTAFEWAIEDCARSLDADRDRITLGGASAGANLAAGAALRLRDAGRTLPAGMILVYPALHPVMPAASMELQDKVARLSEWMAFAPEIFTAILENYLGAPVEAADSYAMPGLAKDLTGLPPTYVVNCEYDSLRASGERFVEQLRIASVPVQARTVLGATHGHLNRPGLPITASTLAQMADWVRSPRVHGQMGPQHRPGLCG